MKKVLVLFFVVLFLAGCGKNKTLECVKEDTEEGYKMTSGLVLAFTEENMTAFKMVYLVEATNSETEKSVEFLDDVLGAPYKEYSSKKGFTFSEEKLSDSYKMTVVIDLAEFEKEDLDKTGLDYGFDYNLTDMNRIKEILEKESYVCEIK